MANHFTFHYPPVSRTRGPASTGPRSPPPPRATEIFVTEDHAAEAVRTIVHTLEFLRVVYCGGSGTDLFAVPPLLVGGAEDGPLPRRPTPVQQQESPRPPMAPPRDSGGSSAAQLMAAGFADIPMVAATGGTSSATLENSGHASPSSNIYHQFDSPAGGTAVASHGGAGAARAGGAASACSSGASAARVGSAVGGGMMSPPSAYHLSGPTDRVALRPYDTISAPLSTLANRTLVSALHTAQASIVALPFSAMLRGTGGTTSAKAGTSPVPPAFGQRPPSTPPAALPNAAPFVLRVRFCKTVQGGIFGYGGRPEAFEEWEFQFVKIRSSAVQPFSPPPPPGAATLQPCPSITPLQASPGGGGDTSNARLGAAAAVENDSLAAAATALSTSTTTVADEPLASSHAMSFGPGRGGAVAAPQPTPVQHALGLAPYSAHPNDPGKLRDVLHFINQKAMQAVDTFVIDELRVAAEVHVEISVVPNERGSASCVTASAPPSATTVAGNSGATAAVSPTPVTTAEPLNNSMTGGIANSITSFFRRK